MPLGQADRLVNEEANLNLFSPFLKVLIVGYQSESMMLCGKSFHLSIHGMRQRIVVNRDDIAVY